MGANIKVFIADDELDSILIGGIEQGIGYWAKVTKYRHNNGEGPVTATIIDPDKGATFNITRATARLGLQRAATSKPHIFSDWLKDRIGDAAIADAIIQLGLFNEIIYG